MSFRDFRSVERTRYLTNGSAEFLLSGRPESYQTSLSEPSRRIAF
jgi:hypothetical protein